MFSHSFNTSLLALSIVHGPKTKVDAGCWLSKNRQSLLTWNLGTFRLDLLGQWWYHSLREEEQASVGEKQR